MGDISPDDRVFKLLLEIEKIKTEQEEAENRHAIELQELQER